MTVATGKSAGRGKAVVMLLVTQENAGRSAVTSVLASVARLGVMATLRSLTLPVLLTTTV